jgi:hypothetical protein
MNVTAISDALALCSTAGDRELPKGVADAQAIARRFAEFPPGIPTATDLLDQLIAAGPRDFDTVLEECSREYARRTFIQATRANGMQNIRVDELLTEAMNDALPTITKRLTPVFTKAATALTRTARELPEGAAALDPAAVLAADAGSSYRVVHEATSRIATIGAVFDVRLRTDGTTRNGSQIVTVVDVPAVGIELIHPVNESRLNDAAELKQIRAIRQLVRDYSTNTQLTLLDVARGTYGDTITLSLATDADDIAARIDRISTAHLSRRVREHDAA